MPGRRLAPTNRAQAVGRGLAGGGVLIGVCLLVAGLSRLAGGDPVAALGNTALLLGMGTLGISALMGGVRPSRWMAYGPRGGEEARRRAAAEPEPGRGPLRLGLAVAGALPFVLFVVLAALHQTG